MSFKTQSNKQTPLAKRIISPLVGFGLLAVFLMLGISAYFFKIQVQQEAKIRSSAIEIALRGAVENLALRSQIQRFVSALGADPNLKGIIIFSTSPPEVIASSYLSLIGKNPQELPLDAIDSEVRKMISLGADVDYTEFSTSYEMLERAFNTKLSDRDVVALTPDKGLIVFHLKIGDIKKIVLKQILTSLSVVIFLLLFAIFIVQQATSRGITKPLASIVEQLHNIHSNSVIDPGKFSQTEVGVLVDAFNKSLDRLKTQQNFLEKILHHAGVAIIATNIDGKITLFNTEAKRILGDASNQLHGKSLAKEWNPSEDEADGMKLPEVIGNKMQDVFLLRDAQGQEGGLMQHFQRQEDFSADGKELMVIRRDGTHFPAQVVAWKVSHGTSYSVCAFIHDMTTRYELEAQQRKRFESETMLKEIHHRVKNNMQVISSLLSLQSAHMDPKRRGVFMECRDRIRAMSLIHERLYTTGQLGRIDFGAYLREMVFLVSSSNKSADLEIDYDIQVESIEVTVDQAVPLSLMASELILNSMKHAFHNRSKGAIIVRLQREDGACRLFIGDDGPGIASGEQCGTSQSIGLKLIDGLAKQIRAQLEKFGGPGAGMTITWQTCTPPKKIRHSKF